MQERHYQAKLIKRIRVLLEGCFILKNDASYLQGVPDLLILYRNRWAMLEVKASADEPFQPNQEYYLSMLDEMSFAAVIYPEIEEDVLHDLQSALSPRRAARVS